MLITKELVLVLVITITHIVALLALLVVECIRGIMPFFSSMSRFSTSA